MSAVLASPFLEPSSNRRPSTLSEVLGHPGIWRGSAETVSPIHTQASGNTSLDALLPGGGWPVGSLIEILIENDGLGELGLVLPALAALTRSRRRVAIIAPPYLPYPPALAAAGIDLDHLVQIDADVADSHWSAEQCLRAGCCAAVVHWLPDADYRQLRRLQLAAETGGALAFVFRPGQVRDQSSPAALRLEISHSETGSCIEILKCRGIMDGRLKRRLPLRTESAPATYPANHSPPFGQPARLLENRAIQ
ncbi:MAG: translesion DNA synthesis-associated protein ImuA [Xanthomonadales bacterium]|nr:translesion DNA synthesis-associated protein ImuA [Xanthomonadales bacterium]